MDRAVVVTGIGVLSTIASGRRDYWDALASGKTAFGPVTLFDTSRSDVRIAGEITGFDASEFLGKKGLRDLDRSTRLLCSAAYLAIGDAALLITEENAHSIGVAVGTTFGSLHSISQFDRQGLLEGPRFVNPSNFPNTVLNSPASRVSIRFNIKGFNTTISTGFCSSLDVVSYAADFISLRRAGAVLAGGVEELCEETFFSFHTLGYLSGSDVSEPICCPFDARRNGIILSEGAAVLVLESSAHAQRRNAEILAVIKGYGNSFDASAKRDFTQSGRGLENAIRLALEQASLAAKDIDYISSSANSTRNLDRMQTNVIKKIFGAQAFTIPVSSVKSMIGETFSASGILALAAAVGSLRNGFIPPTVNYRERDPACDLDYVPNKARAKKVHNALVLSSDPYGNNSAVVLGANGR